ncbi:hypothetical protein IW261DRAFT_98632 [Armillaria novae-zelandiae]|uniref:Uncharacterized protein n=1 Tax=Armillaria novae-zelandiae TaxID=153914 RepID=A0AA39PVZ8_9AGAR|nr:hypothetical protein IW261DRAFT_98632 [Armillaria novae-zelandiae]
MMKVYRLWNHKPIIPVLAVLALLKTRIEVTPPKIMACATTRMPKTIPSAIGIFLLFNTLVILVSIYNALENPRRYEGEIFDSLRRDGSRDFSVLPYFNSRICSDG